ncbi:VanZ family protein [Paenibacillaceae bacterium WGS1546]|uniref:VanZ family protein n=1 Tax=Cohnella sp. WGS1546 TaxID=3366810 RepID=UPI00372CF00C
MLDFYLFPISYAFYTFPIAAAAFTLPFLVVQYRRHGYVHKYRAAMLYLLLLYWMNAFYLIILPLPESVHNAPPEAYAQWIPFRFVSDIVRETDVRLESPGTYFRLLTERAFLQTLFNVLLFVPFGMFMRHYFRARWTVCAIASFGLSLFFEITQVTGIYGIYDYPYRLFDVDDLMTNVAGGMAGYVAAEWLAKWLPRVDRLDEKTDLSARRVSYTQRGIAFLFDWALLLPAIAVLALLRVPYPYVVAVLAYFVALPYMTNGFTLGKWLVRIRLKGQGDRIGLGELAVRYGLLYVLAGGANVAFARAGLHAEIDPILMLLFALVLFAFDAALAIHALKCLFNRRRTPIHEEKSGTTHAIVEKPGVKRIAK